MAEKDNEKKENEIKKEHSYSGSMKNTTNETVSTKREKMVTITFRDNRKFDLHIGRNMVTFNGRESKPIPSSWLTHGDWQNVKNYFLIKGV
jgi:hypothetical protein